MKTGIERTALCGGLALGIFVFLGAGAPASAAEVIELTQTACQFVETEGVDHGYVSARKADCEAINEQTGEARLKSAKVITLKPGDYTFRVTNKNVPYELGFWLRGQGLARLMLPSVSGGGLTQGKTQDYNVTLKPGRYAYSCPLNTTPDYTLVVEE